MQLIVDLILHALVGVLLRTRVVLHGFSFCKTSGLTTKAAGCKVPLYVVLYQRSGVGVLARRIGLAMNKRISFDSTFQILNYFLVFYSRQTYSQYIFAILSMFFILLVIKYAVRKKIHLAKKLQDLIVLIVLFLCVSFFDY